MALRERTSRTSSTAAIALALCCVLGLAVVPGVAAAQSGIGGTVVVEEGETVSSIDAVAGSVVVLGTVTGDVSAVAGDVRIDGTVEGNVDVATGNLRISGDVGGDVSAGAGNVHLQEGATVGGNLNVGAGNVVIDGAVEGDATIGAETIRLGENAQIAGSLTYDGRLTGNTDAVQGDITRDSTLGVGIASEIEPLASAVFTAYAFVLNLLLGAVLLGLFPRFSTAVADRVRTGPVRTGLLGLGVVVGVPLLLLALLITVIGIPLALVGMLAFAVLAWIALVYGRFAVGAWLLGLVDVDNRWLALVLGLAIGAALTFVPWVGGIVNAVIFLLGLGALSWGLYDHGRRLRRERRGSTEAPASD